MGHIIGYTGLAAILISGVYCMACNLIAWGVL